jgi:16S rRNA (guanine527-N7)-methyltransferase
MEKVLGQLDTDLIKSIWIQVNSKKSSNPMQSLIQAAQQLFNIHLNGNQVIALSNYEHQLMDWNQKFNLTAIRDSESIRVKHFLDSLSCVLAWREKPPLSLIDIGTGAGFPGIPLKIIYPAMKLTLVESVGKKVNFCEHIVATLELQNVQVINARAEEVGHDPAHREKYDCAVARAVARLNILAEYLCHL